MDYRIAVPSRSRPGNMGHLSQAVGRFTIVVHPQDYEKYRSFAPESVEVLQVPPGLDLVNKRQWILDNLSEQFLVMLDDDLDHVEVVVGEKARRYSDQEHILPILENSLAIMGDLDIKLGGYPFTLNRFKYISRPDFFAFNQPCSSITLFNGRSLHYDTALTTRHDFDLSLQCLLRHRIIYHDKRFRFAFGKMFSNQGGLQGIRTRDQELKNWDRLKSKWKGHVSLGKTNTTDRIVVRVPRRNPLA